MTAWSRSHPAPRWRAPRWHLTPAQAARARDVAIGALCAILSGGLLALLLRGPPAPGSASAASRELRACQIRPGLLSAG